MARVAGQNADLAAVHKRFEEISAALHCRLKFTKEVATTCNMHRNALDNHWTFYPRDGKWFQYLDMNVTLQPHGDAIMVEAMIPPYTGSEPDVMQELADHLRRHSRTALPIPTIHMTNNGSHYCFVLSDPPFNSGSDIMQQFVMANMWQVITGVMMCCWKTQTEFASYLKHLLIYPPTPDELGRALHSRESGGMGGSGGLPALGPQGAGASGGPVGGASASVDEPARKKTRIVQEAEELFAPYSSYEQCLASFKKHFEPDYYRSSGAYARKRMSHKSMLEAFVRKLEAIWRKTNMIGDHGYTDSCNTSKLSHMIENADSLDQAILQVAFPNTRKYYLSDTAMVFLFPSFSMVAERDARARDSDKRVGEILRELKFEINKGMRLHNNPAGPDTQVHSTIQTREQGLVWELSFGVNRKGPYTPEEMQAFDPKDFHKLDKSGQYVWEKGPSVLTTIRFEDAACLLISCSTKRNGIKICQFPEEPLTEILAKRCSRDTGYYPVVNNRGAADDWRFEVRRHYPAFFKTTHVLSFINTLVGLTMNDKTKLVTDGPSMFEGVDYTPGEGGSGN